MVTADLLGRARAGDGEAFRELTGPHRRELQVHCYRMLGSFADAEDAVQETMLAAWQGIGGFTEERASLRTWLYTIATSRCLNARRAASRRPARERLEPDDPAEPGRLGRLNSGNVPLLGRAPAGRAARVEAPGRGDPVQPGAERGPALEPAKALPGRQHRVLQGVLGVLQGPEHPVAVHLQLPAVRLGQLTKCVAVPGPCP